MQNPKSARTRPGVSRSEFEERREHPRVPLGGNFLCEVEFQGVRRAFYMDDASLAGVRLRTEQMHVFGEMPIGASAVIRSVNCNGSCIQTHVAARIIWIADLEDKVLAGLSIKPCDAADLLLSMPLDLLEI